MSAALAANARGGKNHCRVDWMPGDARRQIPISMYETAGRPRESPAFKCFSRSSSASKAYHVTEQHWRAALPHLPGPTPPHRWPLLVHAELPVRYPRPHQLTAADWVGVPNHLQSRPSSGVVRDSQLLTRRLCREFKFHLHIVHLLGQRRFRNCAPAFGGLR